MSFKFQLQEDHLLVTNKEIHMFTIIPHTKILMMIFHESHDKHNENIKYQTSKFIKCIISSNILHFYKAFFFKY